MIKVIAVDIKVDIPDPCHQSEKAGKFDQVHQPFAQVARVSSQPFSSL